MTEGIYNIATGRKIEEEKFDIDALIKLLSSVE